LDGLSGIKDKAAGPGTSRVDRLLRERLRKCQSNNAIYTDQAPEADQPEVDELPAPERDRLILIANRLPVTAVKDSDRTWKLEKSSGGLASAMLGLDNFDITWVGWPGIFVPPGRSRQELSRALKQQGYHPVYLDESYVDLYYNGFCNQVLWQLFHYVPLNLDSKLSETRTLQMQWKAYQEVNKGFADVALNLYQEGDIVWCQDYHLMLLPELLKRQYPSMKVGWFLHTPFPSSEIYRTLPLREEVLRAALKADLIGFHTYDYARHFVSACTRILGLEGTPDGVEDNGQLTRVAAFPIGIDPDRFTAALRMPQVKNNISELLRRYAGRKVMLGVDRLDMIKGIPQKLLAYEKFLEEHPDWRDKVLLVQIAVPTRTDVPEYQQLRSIVHEIVGRINGKYGTLTHVPIHHLDRSLSFRELCALYAVTDVALVTSLRDGMNLVSYEYVACQSDNAGVLVLSEFAGAAQSLGAGALLVNPWNITDMAAAIKDALCMSDEERRERHRQNYMHVSVHTAQTWADTFISELKDTHVENELRTRHVPPALPLADATREFKCASGRRLLVLGYNATLTQAVEAPRQPKRHFDQIKAQTQVNPDVCNCVCELAAHPMVTVVVFSGSDRERLLETFGDHPNIWLAAENGVFLRPPQQPYEALGSDQGWVTCSPNISNDWTDSVQLVFEYFCERTPRSFVEVRESSLVWNYKYADAEFGRLQARDLLQHMWTGPISNAPVDIVQGARSVEARPVGVSKGASMHTMMEMMREQHGWEAVEFEYVLCMGHFLSRDENLFSFFEGKGVGNVGKDHHQHHRHPVPQAAHSNWMHQLPGAGASGRNPGSRMDGARAGGRDAAGHRGNLPESSTSLLASMMRARGQDKGGDARGRPEGGLVRMGSAPISLPHCKPGNLAPGRNPMRDAPGAEPTRRENGPTSPSRLSTKVQVLQREASQQSFEGTSSSLANMVLEQVPFSLPPKYLYTCTVGRGQSSARYCLGGSKDVAMLLEQFVQVLPEIVAYPSRRSVDSDMTRTPPMSPRQRRVHRSRHTIALTPNEAEALRDEI